MVIKIFNYLIGATLVRFTLGFFLLGLFMSIVFFTTLKTLDFFLTELESLSPNFFNIMLYFGYVEALIVLVGVLVQFKVVKMFFEFFSGTKE